MLTRTSVDAAQAALETEAQSGHGGVHMDGALEAEYFRLQAEAGSKTAQPRRQRDTAARELADEQAALDHARASASDVAGRIQRLQVRIHTRGGAPFVFG